MNILLTAGIALIGTLLSVAGIYNYLPLDILQFRQPEQTFGSTITTIAGSDTLSSSRTVINDNFSALNSTKIENSTTSVAAITTLANLSSIGTITTGVWNGTVIPVNKWGTGTTTPTANQVILGDTTNGFKVVTGFGTTGQYLTSNGSPNAPTWQTSAVDQAISYNWTAHHIFTSLFATNASSTNATTTNLYVSGTPTFVSGVNKKFYLNTSTGAISASQATTTIFSVSVPANTLSTSNAIKCDLYFPIGSATNGALFKLEASYGGAASSTIQTSNIGGGSGNVYTNEVKILLSATGATNTQKLTLSAPQIYNDNTHMEEGIIESTPNIDSTVAQTLFFTAQFLVQNGSIPAGQVVCTLIR